MWVGCVGYVFKGQKHGVVGLERSWKLTEPSDRRIIGSAERRGTVRSSALLATPTLVQAGTPLAFLATRAHSCLTFDQQPQVHFLHTVLQPLYPAVLQPFCPAVLQMLCPTILQPLYPTILQPLCPTVLQSFCPSPPASLPHSPPASLPTVLQLFCPTVHQPLCPTCLRALLNSKYLRQRGMFSVPPEGC